MQVGFSIMATVALESMLLGLPVLGDGGLESHEWHRTTLYYITSLVNKIAFLG